MQSKTVTITCDFCGYGGAYTRSEDFTKHNGFDLCRWCADTTKRAWTETGGHRVTFSQAGNDWICSCGERYVRPLFPSMVPDPVLATASRHLSA